MIVVLFVLCLVQLGNTNGPHQSIGASRLQCSGQILARTPWLAMHKLRPEVKSKI